MKKTYDKVDIEIIKLDMKDIIVTSFICPENDDPCPKDDCLTHGSDIKPGGCTNVAED